MPLLSLATRSAPAAAPLLAADARDAVAADHGARPSLRRVLVAVAGLAAIVGTVLMVAAPAPLGEAANVADDQLPVALLASAPKEHIKAKVQVKLYGMAGCPFTRGFIEGPVSEMLATASDIIDFQLHPFGNHYYITKECGGSAEGQPFGSYFQGYNTTARECFDERCGSAAKEPAPDCFSGPLVSQHGVADAMVTKAWACARYATDDDASRYMPLVECTARHFLGIATEGLFRDIVGRCAKKAGISPRKLLRCAEGSQGKQLFDQQARQTPPHSGVPLAYVNGEELQDTHCVVCTSGLLLKVCRASRSLGNDDTPTCQGILPKV